MPLGGFATLRTPLAAVAARGAVENINDDDVVACDVSLELYCLRVFSLLLCATDTLSLAIRDLETFIYSPLRGNILGRASLCVGAWALYRALDRPEGRASMSDFSAGTEDLAPGKPGTKSPARFITTSESDETPQKACLIGLRLQKASTLSN